MPLEDLENLPGQVLTSCEEKWLGQRRKGSEVTNLTVSPDDFAGRACDVAVCIRVE